MPPTTPAAIERQKEIATLALSAERVAQRMIDRIPEGVKAPATITLSFDEYAQTGVHMSRLAGAAKELHGLLVGGAPTRDEIIHLNGHLTTAAQSLFDAIGLMKAITARLTVEPTADESVL